MMSPRRLDVICCLLVLLVGTAAALWALRYVESQKQRIEEKKALLASLEIQTRETRERLQRAEDLQRRVRERMALLEQRIPQSEQMGDFLNQLDVMLKQRGVTLISVTPLPSQKDKLYLRIPLRVLFEGDFEMIYGLLHDIESMARLLAVEKLSIARPQGSTACRVELSGSLFAR